MKRIISHQNYPEPFEDRRENMPRLEATLKGYLPIIIPIVGVCISVGMYIALVSSTAVLAKDTQCKVETNEIKSIERDEKLRDGYNDNKIRIVKHDETLKYIQEQMTTINNKLDRVLTKIEYR